MMGTDAPAMDSGPPSPAQGDRRGKASPQQVSPGPGGTQRDHPGPVPPLGRLSRTAQGRCRRMLQGQEQHPWAQRCGTDEGSLCGVPSLSSSSRWQPARGPVGSVGWVPGVAQPRTRRAGAELSSSWACWCLVSWWPWWSRLSHTP